MDTGKSSPLPSIKSKKNLHSPAPSDQKSGKVSQSDPLSVKTPGKPADPPRRARHRNAALSIKEVRQAALKLRGRRSDPPVLEDPIAESDIEQPSVKSTKKPAAAEIKLPESYELLDKFFNSLDCSIRLLRLKRSAPTFTNISPQIEYLTDRRFTYNHLAKLKFIMPEAIIIEKVIQLDERTRCMKPDLRITLNVESIEIKTKSKAQSKNVQLMKVFRSRLLDFFKSHPEDDDVPEDPLPEPFNHLKENFSANTVKPSGQSSMGESYNATFSNGQTVPASHLSASFKSRFSRKHYDNHPQNRSEQAQSLSSVPACADQEPKLTGSPSRMVASANIAESPSKIFLKPSNCSSVKATADSISLSPLPETPVKCTHSIIDEDTSCNETPTILRTPADSTPAKLMSSTPMLPPPKRCYMSPDDNSSRSSDKLVRRSPANRPLKFDTPVKNVKVDDDLLDILPESLLQSIQEKEMKAMMEKDPAISQAKWRRQMLANLPKMFDMVYFLFQSIKRSVITKAELMHKIMSGHLAIVDQREVEEQLRLLQELAPEWIHEKSLSSGDVVLCVKKICSPEEIRRRLAEAK